MMDEDWKARALEAERRIRNILTAVGADGADDDTAAKIVALTRERDDLAIIVKGKTFDDGDVPLHNALARAQKAEAAIAEIAVNCPQCGRHDFGLFAGQIKEACGACMERARKAEAELASAREAARVAAQHADDCVKRMALIATRVKDAILEALDTHGTGEGSDFAVVAAFDVSGFK